MGINVNRVNLIAFGIGVGCLGIAGPVMIRPLLGRRAEHRRVLHPHRLRCRSARRHGQLHRRVMWQASSWRSRSRSARCLCRARPRLLSAVPALHPRTAVQARGPVRNGGRDDATSEHFARRCWLLVVLLRGACLKLVHVWHQLHVAFQVPAVRISQLLLEYSWWIRRAACCLATRCLWRSAPIRRPYYCWTSGISPWLGMIAGGTLSALLGLFIGYLSFRYGIKGTYFGLVTVAFTEIGRIVALNTPAIGGALGLYIPIQSNDVWQLKFASTRRPVLLRRGRIPAARAGGDGSGSSAARPDTSWLRSARTRTPRRHSVSM